MKRVLVLGLLVVAVASTWMATSGAAPRREVTLRLALSAPTLRAGASETVVVTLVNNGAAVALASCGVDVAVGLVNANVHFSVAWPDDVCLHDALRHGTTALHLRLASVYSYCGGSDAPPCSAGGTAPLPKGKYHTTVKTHGFPSSLRVVAATSTVTLD